MQLKEDLQAGDEITIQIAPFGDGRAPARPPSPLNASAKRSLILIDNWATPEVLDLFAKKRALGKCCQCDNVASLNKTLAAHPHFHATNP